MSSATVHPQAKWDQLLQAWQELDIPEGWRAEILGELITLVPPPGLPHHNINHRLNKTLVQSVPDGLGLYFSLGLTVPALGKLFMPDVAVLPEAEVTSSGGTDTLAELALMVVEITSKSNADTDRTTKLSAYAHAPVPVYLLIDRFDAAGPTVTVYSEPKAGRYDRVQRVAFGKPVEIPEPIGFTIPTDEF